MSDRAFKQATRAMLDCGVQLDEQGRKNVVRSVLLAMRNPSDAMLTAAAGLTEGEGGPTETWQAMIDAALADE